MVKDLYQKSFSVLMKRPFRLWGLSLLAGVLLLAAQVGFIGVPAVPFCAALLLDASMAMIYLNSYRTGLEPKTAYLFSAFRKERVWHVLGGMAWMYLWIFLWSLIPVVGIVFGVIRAYEYRFTPYILMTRDDVKPTEAIKVSKAETMGYKGKMFGADMPGDRRVDRGDRGAVAARCDPVPRRAVQDRALRVQSGLQPAGPAVFRHSERGVLCGDPEPARSCAAAAVRTGAARDPGPGPYARDAARTAGRAGRHGACPGRSAGNDGTRA